jgi:hypothetical protein
MQQREHIVRDQRQRIGHKISANPPLSGDVGPELNGREALRTRSPLSLRRGLGGLGINPHSHRISDEVGLALTHLLRGSSEGGNEVRTGSELTTGDGITISAQLSYRGMMIPRRQQVFRSCSCAELSARCSDRWITTKRLDEIVHHTQRLRDWRLSGFISCDLVLETLATRYLSGNIVCPTRLCFIYPQMMASARR